MHSNSRLWEAVLVLMCDPAMNASQPDMFSGNAVLSACAQGIQWGAALGLLQEAAKRLLRHDLISCDTTVHSCEKGV